MSRIGNKPIVIPQGVEVKMLDGVCVVKANNVTLSQKVNPAIDVQIDDGMIVIKRASDIKEHRALHGLTRALIFNMVTGVKDGFSKELSIEGIGYRAAKEGKNLVLTVGLSHTVNMPEPDGISIECPKPTQIIVKGADKQLVGETAAKIRAVRPPEPYKGKGIRYANETVRLKEGKTGAK